MKLKIFVSDEREKKARKAKTGKAAKEPKAKQAAKAAKPNETKPPKETDEKAKARRAFWARKKAIEKKNANKAAEELKQN